MLRASVSGEPRPEATPEPGTVASSARSAPLLQIHTVPGPERDRVERFIHQVYAAHHGAAVRHFMPVLVSLSNEHGELTAAAGYRVASETLYLERYLDDPVDQLLATYQGSVPPRSQIVEVGHLSAAHAGAGKQLIVALGRHLADLQMQWVVGTLTQELRHLFIRMGVTPLALGAADAGRLGDEAADWGRYYDHHPVVLAGHLGLALRSLRRAPSGEE